MKHETRVVGGALAGLKVEKRAEGDAGGRTLVGYAIVFNQLSELLGGAFRERIAPGAADEVLSRNPDIRCLINHDDSLVLGRTTAGTCRGVSDAHGVRVETDLGTRSYELDLAQSIDRGDVNQMSFAFRVAMDGDMWAEEVVEGQLCLVRTVQNFGGLFDYSVVTFPAYPQTEAALRSAKEFASKRSSRKTLAKNWAEILDRFAQ